MRRTVDFKMLRGEAVLEALNTEIDNIYRILREPKVKKKIQDTGFIEELKKVYFWLDVEKELAKMDGWLLDNPHRKKSKRFILTWLNGAEDKRPVEMQESLGKVKKLANEAYKPLPAKERPRLEDDFESAVKAKWQSLTRSEKRELMLVEWKRLKDDPANEAFLKMSSNDFIKARCERMALKTLSDNLSKPKNGV